MRIMPIIALLTGLVLVSCDLFNAAAPKEKEILSNQYIDNYFPLDVNLFWEYELTYSRVDTEQLPFPSNFTTRIIDVVEFNENSYYRLINYHRANMPTPGDTVMIRQSEKNILILMEGEDKLFYSFDHNEEFWSLPLYIDQDMTLQGEFVVHVSSKDDEEIVIHWNFPRSGLNWEEYFKKGIGRTKIVVRSRAFGKYIWELKNTNAVNGG